MATTKQVAESIVHQSLRPQEYEAVAVTTYPHTLELAESVVLECQRVGADPLLVLETDAVFYGQFENYSLANLRRTSAHCLGIAEYVDSYVWLGGPQDPAPMRKVPREKWAAMFEGEQAHYEKSLEKKQKSVGVALGQVTSERARAYGFPYDPWKEMVEAAIAVDYGKMASQARDLGAFLARAGEVRLTADNGTDLTFRLAGADRPPHVDDGVISPEDVAVGNTDTHLPAGAVWVAPLEESAQGRFVADVAIPQMGDLIEGLEWTFRDGRVTDFAAKRNLELAQVNWEEAAGEKDRLGAFAVGVNPAAQPGFLQNMVVAGTVTLGIGDNQELGGGNRSGYGFHASLTRGTVRLDGELVVEAGRLVA